MVLELETGHMTIAKAFADSARIDATQEVLSLGVTNMIACFFSSMPVAGSFSRTTVNAFSGAESPLGKFFLPFKETSLN